MSTGTLLSAVVPLPSWPRLFLPQHVMPPPASSAHVWKPPAEICSTPLERPLTLTGRLLDVVVPSPSWP
jgi:hypothetical protein